MAEHIKWLATDDYHETTEVKFMALVEAWIFKVLLHDQILKRIY